MSNNSLRNYEIRQKLGSGSYGVIYKAVNKNDKSVCVLKQISLTRMSEKARKNAANQAHIMGRLKHPFIVCYYNSFVEDNNLNILMQFCEGGDLCYFLKQQNKKYLKQQKIWKFFIEICMGLEHIHKNKILHRDIKTLNIFLNKNETVKIGDLGVAKALNTNDFARTMVGTPFYLSPELCEEKPYNEKSDIWALGCLLYELCTFKHPFEATNQASLILKIIRGKYQPIPQFYSKELRQMIDFCLERDYKRRPTANMILSKPNIKKMIEGFELNKMVDEFYKSSVPQQPVPVQPTKKQSKPENKPPPENKTPIPKPEIKNSAQKQKKALDNQVPLGKPQIPVKPSIERNKQEVKDDSKDKRGEVNQQENFLNRKRQSQPVIKVTQIKNDKPKVLFGKTPQNKLDFVNALQSKLKDQPPKAVEISKPEQISKKAPISFEIPIKQSKQIKKSTSQKINVQIQQKSIFPNKNISNKQSEEACKSAKVIHVVKMQKKVEPKVYDQIKEIQKPSFVIKSGGFNKQSDPIKRSESAFDAKKSQNLAKHLENVKAYDKRMSSQSNIKQASKESKNLEKPPIYGSVKNIRKKSDEVQKYPPIKKEVSVQNNIYNYPPKPRKIAGGQQQGEKAPPKYLPNPKKVSMSVSRFTQVTKEEQDLVANLPDIVKKEKLSDDQADQKRESQKNIRFKQIDDNKVAQLYEQMLSTTRSAQRYAQDKQDTVQHKEQGQEAQEEVRWEDHIQDHFEEEEDNQQMGVSAKFRNSDAFYEINKYETGEEEQENKETNQKQGTKEHQWSFDEQPELPMMQQTESPEFEEVNPYLVDQPDVSEQEALENKKQYLQTKLKQNMKREDELNRFMQMKIEECRFVAPKNLEEILNFFRSKINMAQQYTSQDEKQIERFLAERNLTDERKFQNIYKIMHFEMELENTRKIIQQICKKLNELENQK